MDGIKLLRAEARAKRDKAMQEARIEYLLATREIRAVERKLRSADARRRVRRASRYMADRDESFKTLTVVQAAERLLQAGKPLTVVELTIELQRRGCRANDDPKAVANAVRSGLAYHGDRFYRDGAGRWVIRVPQF